MPPAISYAPADMDLMRAADDEHKKRESVRQRAEAWYDGRIPDVLQTERTPRGAAINNNVKINLFGKRCDRRRDFLFKLFPQLDIDDAPEESTNEKWLREAWEWNRAATLWGLALLNGAFTGQVYMRFMEAREGRDLYPRALLLPDVITFTQADDVETHLWYSQYYKVGKKLFRQDFVDLALNKLADRGWGLYLYVKNSDNRQGWQEVYEARDLWDYDLGPIITWQHWPRTGRCYGEGEFGDIDLNTAVNRIMSLGNAVIHNHAFPKTIVAGGQMPEKVPTGPANVWNVPKDTQVYNLEMQSDLSAILNFVERLTADYNTQGRTVDVAGGPADFSSITNLAIKVSFTPQDDANEILRRQYGGALVEGSRRLQMLAGQLHDVAPKVIWKTALPESKAEVSQTVLVEDQLQLASKETQATQMGLDWLKEQKRKEDEAAQAQGMAVGAFGADEQAKLLAFYDTLKQKMEGGTNGSKPPASAPLTGLASGRGAR
jgi:hypothetical protein